jgi:hypothetical protein
MLAASVADKKQNRKIELEPDAWQRFERAVDVVAKSPPQHRIATKRKRERGRKNHNQITTV